MVKKNKKLKSKFSTRKFFEQAFLTIIGIVFVGFGSIAIFNNKLSATGSVLRGVGWEVEGLPAIGMGFFIIYIGAVIIFYTFRDR